MSSAGTASSQGDEYQLCIALYWLIQLLEDDAIRGIQAESMGIPGQDFPVTVDDVIILFTDGHIRFIQAKKNQPQYHNWSFTGLQDELHKAYTQLSATSSAEVWFYSRSPFGEIQALVEGCRTYPEFAAFVRDAPKTLSKSIQRLAEIWSCSKEETYALAKRLGFGPAHTFEEWNRQNRAALDRIIPRVDLAMPLLERYLMSHQTKLRDFSPIITRDDVRAVLAKKGLYPTPKRHEADILAVFAAASRIGRQWLRTVDGERIPRPELSHLIALIEQRSRSILLTDRPGSGKTCVLLDLVDYIETLPSCGLLFIQGNQFTDVETERDLVARGLPEDIVGQCARLASLRRVVVVIDSLDVLSLSRRHGALRVFLGLIDRLEKIDGVTVVIACRDFDLQYDPLLRGREWQHRVPLKDLDYDRVVVPFLHKWGIEPTSLSPELRVLLQLPQNLRLFEKLTGLSGALHLTSAYELYESFIEEVVTKDLHLGERALAALQHMANRLMQERKQTYPKVAFRAEETVVQRLISQEVLSESSLGMLSFSHQTLADSLMVRTALAQDRTLADFILAHPQLPFIRPAIRTFFFSLRVHQPDVFRRQIWAVLSHDQIAYHVKRLLSESLAEIIPVEEDWGLLRRLFQQYPDLFRRLLRRVDNDAWFDILRRRWLPEVRMVQDQENVVLQFIACLRLWVNRHATAVVALWRDAFTSAWMDKHNLLWEVSAGLDKFEAWDTEGIRELLEIMVAASGEDQYFLGKHLSRWVQATQSGDDLLWRYVTKDIVSSDDVVRWRLGEKLLCAPHDFHHQAFLAERLWQSDSLLSLVVDDLERWSACDAVQVRNDGLHNAFLQATSWDQQHSQRDAHHADNLRILLDTLEDALKHRARREDAWWHMNEPRLRTTREVAIRYLMIQAYKENLEANIPGIEAQLQDRELLRCSHLAYELGELMRLVYPSIAESAQDVNQTMILSLYADADWGADGPPTDVSQHIYTLLLWIPPLFRTPATQDFITSWQHHVGDSLPSPRIYSTSGYVTPPLSVQQVLALSNSTLFRLLHYYNTPSKYASFDDGLVGGRDTIQWLLREACSRHPERFLSLCADLIEEDLHHGYLSAIVDGIADHLRFRFGNLSPSNGWEPVAPVPEGNVLATALLALVERYSILSEHGLTVSHALAACCHVLDDSESAERLTFLLFALLHAQDPGAEPMAKDRDLLARVAINSTRGVGAESAMILCNNLLAKDHPLPPLLPPLLRHYARDSAISVRVSILHRLPYLTSKRPDLGWQVFADVFREPQGHLWGHAGECLYYQYRHHFDKVRPYLDRIRQEGMEEAGDIWGRIAALASLAGHISEDQLFDTLMTARANAWEGVTEVFSANLGLREHIGACSVGLLTLLRRGEVSDRILRTVAHCFGAQVPDDAYSRELALAFLGKLAEFQKPLDPHDFLTWLGYESRRDPFSVLEVAEALADTLERQATSHRLWQPEPLVAALVEILREADEVDDRVLIQRAITLQDRFLKLDIPGIDALLDQAGRI